MKTNTKYVRLPLWGIVGVLTLSLGFSIWALIIANSDDRGNCEMILNYTKVIELAGLIFTVVGVVFSLFFVIVGINANRIRKDINSIDENITEKAALIEKELKGIESDNLYNMYGHLLDMAKYINGKKERERKINSLTLARARLTTQSNLLSKDKRLQRMPALDLLGTLEDIADLDKIINSPTEDDEIIESAKIRKEEIKQRLGIN